MAETSGGFQVLETSHPPTYYLPPEDIRLDRLREVEGRGSFCEWKGSATYFDIVIEDRTLNRACWTYRNPSATFTALRHHIAFYAAEMDECTVDGEIVTPQPGGFYGGWITSHVAGPFKGEPGTRHW